MKTGCLYIDGNDAYSTYGAFVVEGGWNSLVCMPPLKSVKSTDWQEYDGIEADLSAPALNTREVEIQFAFVGLYSRFLQMIADLSDGAYHTFRCTEIGRTFKLRMTQQSAIGGVKQLETVTLKFADDFPMLGFEYEAPVTSIAQSDRFMVDDVPLTSYGVNILDGTMQNIRKSADVKEALLRNIATQGGAEYDSRSVRYKSKDVKLLCLLRARSLDEMWRNYYALLHDLIQPEERTLYVSDIEDEFRFYYKSCTVQNFFPCDEKVWLEFSLTVCFTQDVRVDEDDMVLATEDRVVVWTEDSDSAVEVLPNRFYYPSLRMVQDNSIRLISNGAFRFNN